MQLVPENLEEHIEMNIQRFDAHDKMRSEVVSFLGQKASKDSNDGGAVPMGLDAKKGTGKAKGGKDNAKTTVTCHHCGKAALLQRCCLKCHAVSNKPFALLDTGLASTAELATLRPALAANKMTWHSPKILGTHFLHQSPADSSPSPVGVRFRPLVRPSSRPFFLLPRRELLAHLSPQHLEVLNFWLLILFGPGSSAPPEPRGASPYLCFWQSSCLLCPSGSESLSCPGDLTFLGLALASVLWRIERKTVCSNNLEQND